MSHLVLHRHATKLSFIFRALTENLILEGSARDAFPRVTIIPPFSRSLHRRKPSESVKVTQSGLEDHSFHRQDEYWIVEGVAEDPFFWWFGLSAAEVNYLSKPDVSLTGL